MSVCRHQPCDRPECEAHVHHGAVGWMPCWILVYCDELIATAGDYSVACRLAELVNRHGLVDIPEPCTFAGT